MSSRMYVPNLQGRLGGGVQGLKEPVAAVVLVWVWLLLWGLSLVVAQQQVHAVLLPHMMACMHLLLLAALLQLFLAKIDEKGQSSCNSHSFILLRSTVHE